MVCDRNEGPKFPPIRATELLSRDSCRETRPPACGGGAKGAKLFRRRGDAETPENAAAKTQSSDVFDLRPFARFSPAERGAVRRRGTFQPDTPGFAPLPLTFPKVPVAGANVADAMSENKGVANEPEDAATKSFRYPHRDVPRGRDRHAPGGPRQTLWRERPHAGRTVGSGPWRGTTRKLNGGAAGAARTSDVQPAPCVEEPALKRCGFIARDFVISNRDFRSHQKALIGPAPRTLDPRDRVAPRITLKSGLA